MFLVLVVCQHLLMLNLQLDKVISASKLVSRFIAFSTIRTDNSLLWALSFVLHAVLCLYPQEASRVPQVVIVYLNSL